MIVRTEDFWDTTPLVNKNRGRSSLEGQFTESKTWTKHRLDKRGSEAVIFTFSQQHT